MSNSVLVGLIGRHPHWVSRLRAGHVDPKLSEAALIAEALRVDIRDLLEEDGDGR